MKNMFRKRKYSICGKEYEGCGNNAQPVNNGRCCDECNAKVVIPTRMHEWTWKEHCDD